MPIRLPVGDEIQDSGRSKQGFHAALHKHAEKLILSLFDTALPEAQQSQILDNVSIWLDQEILEFRPQKRSTKSWQMVRSRLLRRPIESA
ncbi:hypothetical protein [Mesorhizobium cantuariense]|uniref:Uncharacterized protein n=1 Tax=Mesorhizobium cantuariense TaxID=1300275 RepID=A0ABV7MY66_9HYPH